MHVLYNYECIEQSACAVLVHVKINMHLIDTDVNYEFQLPTCA